MRRALAIAFKAFVLLIFFIIVGAWVTVRRSFPDTGGITVPGLDAEVEVVRDPSGVPHIYASTPHDLFMAQGYVHAQVRFWQMDFWRHIGSGRLGEMFGESQLETDKFLRTLGWAEIAEQELRDSDPNVRALLEAYAAGVNAYLADHKGASLSLEYVILRLTNPGYVPEPWTPQHSLTWAKVMAWDLGGNMSEEIQRAVLTPLLGPERLEELYPPYPAMHPVIVPDMAGRAPQDEGTAASDTHIPPSLLHALSTRVQALQGLTGGGLSGIGSNNWVIAGERTTTGLPLLANDMHLGIQMPSIWYENSLHCMEVGPDCPYAVSGFSFAGVPAVIVGHNADIAWGVTNVNPDVQDLYLERINPENPNQYQVNGEWVDMETREETIHIAGGESETITVRQTRHGPLLSDFDEDLEALSQLGAGPVGPMAISLRWTGLEPSSILRAVFHLNLASDWREFQAALQHWDVPSQNFVYADVSGNIGYQTPGRIPIRARGDGSSPVPGWTDEYEWTGYISFDELPTSFNPPEGYIATANNAVAGPEYPRFLGTSWDYGYRADRIQELIQQAGTLSIEDIQRIQADNYHAMGPILIPLLESLDLEPHGDGSEPDREDLREYVALLSGWDYQNDMDSAPAALFNAFWRHLILDTFADDLPLDWLPDDSRGFMVISQLLESPTNPWWDDRSTSTPEDRDMIMRQALTDAVQELRTALGEDPKGWSWGDLHTATFRNQSLGQSGIAPIEALFNRGPYAVGGGSSIINATGWDVWKGYQVRSLPSERMIVDLSDFDNSLWIHPTGQSGHAFHRHYADMVDLWRQVGYRPMLWTPEAVSSAYPLPDGLSLRPPNETR